MVDKRMFKYKWKIEEQRRGLLLIKNTVFSSIGWLVIAGNTVELKCIPQWTKIIVQNRSYIAHGTTITSNQFSNYREYCHKRAPLPTMTMK